MNIMFDILLIFSCVLALYNLLTLLQQNHYHYNFFSSLYKQLRFKENIFILGSILYINNITCKIFAVIFLIIYIILMKKKKYIIKLKFTQRIKRILIVNIILIAIHYIFFFKNLLIIILPLYLLLTLFILTPIEKLINLYYISLAKQKLKQIHPICIVITGSAGKTSVKNYLYEILKNEYITFMTPLSYNTPLGISKAINETMNYKTEIAIFEFGASHKNDITKLLKIVKPNIGIITNILPQHLKTFKKIENIFNEKLKVFAASDVCIYNSDIISPIIKKGIDVVTISKEKRAKYTLSDIVYNKYSTEFKINNYSFKTSLIGKCNLENIVLAIIAANYLRMSFKKIESVISNIKPVKDRLEIKTININNKEVIVINDSFNSNIKGFKNALDVLDSFEGKRVIITPGIMECGKKAKDINYDIGTILLNKNLDICIIKNRDSKYLINAFNDHNFDNFIIFEKFIDCYNFVINKYDVVLIENDISDVYK